jgi:hypothetical protein
MRQLYHCNSLVGKSGYSPKFRAFALLDELIGEEPSLWSFEDRKFDPDLLARLERMLLEWTLAKLASDSLNTLERYCVYRKAVKAKAFKEVSAGISDVPGKRRLLIDRFLVEHDRGWDRPSLSKSPANPS